MLDQIIGDLGEEEVADTRVKPALLTLLHDQAALANHDDLAGIDGDIRTGFATRRELIDWYQRAAVRTVGHIADTWPPEDCIRDDVLVAAMVRDPVGEVDSMPAEKAIEYRRVVETKYLQPACRKGFREIRDGANEYISESDQDVRHNDLDPSRQKNVAMRPGFQSLDEQQQRTLDIFWGGFESRDEVIEWLHGLNSPTNGEIDPEVPSQVINDPVAMKYLHEERETAEAKVYRAAMAATVLLPAFVAGVRSMETAELATAAAEGQTTMRMAEAGGNE